MRGRGVLERERLPRLADDLAREHEVEDSSAIAASSSRVDV